MCNNFLFIKWVKIFFVILIFLLIFTLPGRHVGAEEPGIKPVVSPESLKYDSDDPDSGESGMENGKTADKTDVLTLEDCIEMALENHPDIKSSFALKKAAEAGITTTTSSYFPQISYGFSYSRAEANKTIFDEDGNIIPQSADSGSDSYGNTLSLSQNIYDFGRTRYRVMAAKENLNIASYDLIIGADQIILDVQNAYYKAVAAEKFVSIQEQSVSQRELQLKQAQNFYKFGRRSKIEVTKAEIDLANAQLDLIKAENQKKLTMVDLANAIGISGEFNHVLDDNLNIPEIEMDVETAVRYAREHRPEILKLNAQERAQAVSLDLKKADYLPTINATASYGYRGERLSFRDVAWGWGVTLKLDLLTWGRRSGSVQEEKFRLESIREQKERTWQNIYKEIQSAYLGMTEARTRISVLEKALVSARENFDLARGRYETGLSSNLEYADAQLSLQKAENDLVSAAADYLISRAKLEKATGLSVVSRNLINRYTEENTQEIKNGK